MLTAADATFAKLTADFHNTITLLTRTYGQLLAAATERAERAEQWAIAAEKDRDAARLEASKLHILLNEMKAKEAQHLEEGPPP